MLNILRNAVIIIVLSVGGTIGVIQYSGGFETPESGKVEFNYTAQELAELKDYDSLADMEEDFYNAMDKESNVSLNQWEKQQGYDTEEVSGRIAIINKSLKSDLLGELPERLNITKSENRRGFKTYVADLMQDLIGLDRVIELGKR